MRLRGARGPACIACACLFTVAGAPPAMPQTAPGLTFEEASRLAGSSSEAIRIRELAVQKSRLAVQEAQGKAWPHLDFDASGSYLVQPPPGYTVSAGALGVLPIPPKPLPIPPEDFTIGAQPYNYFSIAATVSQPLFTWGKIRNAVDAAALQVDSAATDLLLQRRDIEREVHRAYFSALLAQESEKVLRRLEESAAQIVADRQTAQDQGTTTKEGVLEARARRAQFESRLAVAGQSRATALESLGVLTGLEPAGIELATGFHDSMPALDEETLRTRVRDASTDIASSRTRQSLAQKGLAIEKGGATLRPDLALGISVAATGQENYLVLNGSSLNSNASTSWTWDLIISLDMKMSVFDGLESAARIGQAEKDVEAAGLAVAQAEKLSRLAVRRAVDAAAKADADLAEKEAQEEYAAERLKNAQASAENGMASREDLHAAEISHGSAQLDRLLAQFTREEALADIARLTGDAP